MQLVVSNRLEILADHLLSHWPEAAQDRLEPQPIVVPTLGVARWLTYRIATHFGICAQVEFVYPAQFVWRLFERILPSIKAESPFDADSLTWRIYSALGDRAFIDARNAMAAVAHYLAQGEPRDRLALARRIAQFYADVLVARPQWAPRWQRGERLDLEPAPHERWLGALWQRIAKGIAEASAEHPRDATFRLLKADADRALRLPSPLVLFGLPQLAPQYQQIFEDLSVYTEVTAYLVNPSAAYWFDLRSEKVRAREEPAHSASAFGDDNRLLAALGRQTQEHLLLWGVDDDDRLQASGIVLEPLYVEPSGESLLGRVQQAVFAALPALEVSPMGAGDTSLRVHVCHSLVRQLEILHDELLRLIDDKGAGLSPGDILVLVPDVDASAATIDAVFGGTLASRRLPYNVSGRSRDLTTPILEAFFTLLALPSSRFGVSMISSLLDTTAIAARLGIDTHARARIGEWLEAVGVHWGRDADSRAREGLPETERHSFAEGLAALFLGYGMQSTRPLTVAGVLPHEDIEGKDAEVLGVLAEFVSRLAHLADDLGRTRPLAAWLTSFREMLDQYFDANCDPGDELLRLDAAFRAVSNDGMRAGLEESLPLSVVVDALRHALGKTALGAVPGGGITFASFGPLRLIPYAVVAMLDLNGDGTFPRDPQRAEFDLLARNRQLGDRDLLAEDRAAFLDAVLAARSALALFYTGRSARDNARLPASSVVEDLLEAAGAVTEGGRVALERAVVIEHPLQAFSPRHFDGSMARSYAAELMPAGVDDRARPAFVDEARIPLPEAEWRDIDLAAMARALRNPIRHLLEKRVGLALFEEELGHEDDEPMLLHKRAARRVARQLYAATQKGASEKELSDLAAALPDIPEGELGPALVQEQLSEVRRFFNLVGSIRPRALQTRLFTLTRGPFRLSGSIEGVHREGRFMSRFVDGRDGEQIEPWLAHLVLNLHAFEWGVARPCSTLVFRDAVMTMEPVANAGEILDDLLGLYWEGLVKPVPLIPDVSAFYVEKGADDAAARAATARWAGSGSQQGFVRNRAREYRVTYGRVRDELPAGFSTYATRLFTPLQAHSHRTDLPPEHMPSRHPSEAQ